jgi:hypothetical protein
MQIGINSPNTVTLHNGKWVLTRVPMMSTESKMEGSQQHRIGLSAQIGALTQLRVWPEKLLAHLD